VNRWGAGIVQEIDSAAMHVFFRWQHLELNDFRLVCTDVTFGCISGNHVVEAGQRVNGGGFKDLDLFQIGGVIFF